jgi:hypothetical protein
MRATGVAVEIKDLCGDRTHVFAARPAGPRGRYVARVRFPASGVWQYTLLATAPERLRMTYDRPIIIGQADGACLSGSPDTPAQNGAAPLTPEGWNAAPPHQPAAAPAPPQADGSAAASGDGGSGGGATLVIGIAILAAAALTGLLLARRRPRPARA